MQPETGFVPTSIAQTILSRMEVVHRTRRIAVLSGPPGIGKTTAIGEFVSANPREVAVVTVQKERASTRLVMQYALEAVRRLTGNMGGYVYGETYMVARQFRQEVNDLFNFCHGNGDRLTLVFDEAQTLSKSAIEELRYLNDAVGGDLPFKIGLVFVGNHEFSLKADRAGQSVLTAAVADRARFIESFDYSDLTNQDMAMFIEARGITDSEAIGAIVKHFSAPRAVRSFRRVSDFLDDILDEANGKPVTAEIVRSLI